MTKLLFVKGEQEFWEVVKMGVEECFGVEIEGIFEGEEVVFGNRNVLEGIGLGTPEAFMESLL